ncbi:hypothetical protein [Oceanobacillus oncorhynchi]|uniref:hypothetical protein n=1 Tax=Oceanobacillus oncorhynchi TaxID=545501 RepID=UPI002F96869A
MEDKRTKVEIIVISIIGINMIFLMFFLMYFMFNFSKEIVTGLIAFVGAILGGFITLFGVKLTIENNEKQKAKEELPIKILNMEKAVNEIDKIVSGLEDGMVLTVLDLNKNMVLYTNEIYKKYTDDILNGIRDYLILVDSESYKIFLDTREKMNILEFELNELQIRLFDFYERYNEPEKMNKNYMDNYLADKSKIEKEVVKKNNIISYKIMMNYGDLFIQLQLKQESLIKEMDY